MSKIVDFHWLYSTNYFIPALAPQKRKTNLNIFENSVKNVKKGSKKGGQN